MFALMHSTFPCQLGIAVRAQEYSNLEKEIDALTAQKEQLDRELEAAAVADFQSLAALSLELARVVEDIDRKTERWLELADAFDM
jgi:ABC transport system ATP-binding/permease protein